MKTSILKFTFLTLLLLATSCSKADSNETSLVGTWKLTTWTIDIPMDLNHDGSFNDNLLDEANCENRETLIFDLNGTFSSNLTYNPTVVVTLENDEIENYIFDVVCDSEGTIGLAGSYTQDGSALILLGKEAIVVNNQIMIIYENAINIYSGNSSEIVTTRDLTLIYSKK